MYPFLQVCPPFCPKMSKFAQICPNLPILSTFVHLARKQVVRKLVTPFKGKQSKAFLRGNKQEMYVRPLFPLLDKSEIPKLLFFHAKHVPKCCFLLELEQSKLNGPQRANNQLWKLAGRRRAGPRSLGLSPQWSINTPRASTFWPLSLLVSCVLRSILSVLSSLSTSIFALFEF